ncbi:MAG: hypothetical protein KAR47_16120, partial [Planctomycetes bacterium]|nr:hypothetical protein [Planctomycetota bacterium]
KTLAGMFALTDCDNGFTMALLGDWGQGKSTVMGLLQTELEKKHKGKFEFATYNAWEYEKTENVSAGIAQEVVKGLIGKIGGWQKISLRRKFAWREYNEKLRGLLITTLLALNIAVILWDIALLFDDISSWCNAVAAVFGLSAIGLPVFSFKDLKKIFEHPLSTQLQTYLKLPDYGEHLGLIPVLKRHIKILCDFQLDKKKLVVFVDDLDRCNVDHIAKVLDAIRLVMTIPNVIVMIGIDHRIAFKAIQKHYKELADGDDRRGVAEIARDYLGKIIQLPLQLRAASHEELEEYVFEKLFDKKNIVDDTKLKEKAEVGLTEHGKQKAEVKLKLDIKTVREAVLNNRGGHEQTSDQGVMTIWNSLGKETKRKYLESINGGNSVAAEVEVTEKDMKEAIKDKKSEQKAFYELAGTFEFSNPRQLLRLHNSFRFLKGFGRGTGKGYETLDMLKMLFWQEFLHNWPKNVRGACMAELMGKKHSVQLEPKVRSVLDNVKGDDVQLFNEPESYEQMAKFVRMVVLPHNEEGVLDKQTDIDAWIKKADEEERRLARIRAKEEGQGSA